MGPHGVVLKTPISTPRFSVAPPLQLGSSSNPGTSSTFHISSSCAYLALPRPFLPRCATRSVPCPRQMVRLTLSALRSSSHAATSWAMDARKTACAALGSVIRNTTTVAALLVNPATRTRIAVAAQPAISTPTNARIVVRTEMHVRGTRVSPLLPQAIRR